MSSARVNCQNFKCFFNLAIVLSLLLLTCTERTFAQPIGSLGEVVCGSLDNSVGPMDYHSKSPEALRLLEDVEFNHFNANVQTLESGQTGISPMGDLDYVLRAFPNHPEALMLIARFQLAGGKYAGFRTVECYFDRAVRLKHDDAMVFMLYGIYMTYRNEYQSAVQAYKIAVKLSPNYAEAHYNLGLSLVKLERLTEAKTHATIAYDLGYPLPGLRNQLIRRQAWDE